MISRPFPRLHPQDRKAILLVAHTDSPVASVGAADDAMNIVTMLETARALAARLVAGEEPLATPVMFLFNGGEESFSQVRLCSWL